MNTTVGRGYVQVYTGSGKGKTTAALGLAMRAVGSGLKVLVVQFLKGADASGEASAAGRLAPDFEIRSLGRDNVVAPSEITAEDGARSMDAFAEAAREIRSCEWDVIILDEINTACSLGLIPVDDVLGLIRDKPEGLELVLTGRGAAEEVMAAADLVTEMKEIKHYYRQGVAARKGIEK